MIKRIIGSKGFWSVVDQSLFTGTNFVTAVLLGHFGGTSQLGLYTLWFSLVMLAINASRAGLITPYVIIHRHLDVAERSSLRGWLLVATVAFGVCLTGIAGLAELVIGIGTTSVLATALPAGLIRDFARRLAISDLELVPAVCIDLTIAVLQICVISFLAVTNQLTAVSALISSSVVWLAIGLLAIAAMHKRFHIRRIGRPIQLGRIWTIGKWSGLGQLVSVAQVFLLPWILAFAHSLQLAGIYAACWTIVQITSPAIEGLGNILSPELARSAQGQNWNLFRQQTQNCTWQIAGLMAALLIAVASIGQSVLTILYGQEFSPHADILFLICLAATVFNLGIPAANALTQVGYVAANCWIAMAGLLVTTAMAWPLLSLAGETGAAWGLIIAGAGCSSARWWLYRRFLIDPSRRAPYTAVPLSKSRKSRALPSTDLEGSTG